MGVQAPGGGAGGGVGIRCAVGGGMHAVMFGVKRWHLQIVEASKRLLQPDSLTPARFDMMRAIAARGGELRQRNLQYLLGVSAVTISKMLKGLEEKGFLVRTRLERDRRFKNVIITASGHAALEADLRYCVDSRINEYLAAALVTGDRYVNIDSATVRRRIEEASDHLIYGRRILRDRSPVRHPWSRGDFALLGFVALEHEQNPHPLQRGRIPRTKDTPRPWEIPPKPLRGATPRVRGPGLRRGRARMTIEQLGDIERRAQAANAEVAEAEEFARRANEEAAARVWPTSSKVTEGDLA